MKTLKVEKNQKLIDFLSERLKISKKKAKKIIDTKNVFVNNKRIWIASHPVKKGDIVKIPETDTINRKNKKIDILYEDRYIIAVNKPPFLVSDLEKNSIEDILRREISKDMKAIHRLDKETSGVLLFAKNFEIFKTFKNIWNEKHIKKEYIAISHNKATFKHKVINLKIDNKPAISIVKTLKTFNNYSFFSVQPITGRKHQIRIHLSKIGHPIVADKEYGLKIVQSDYEKKVKRHLLHAKNLQIFHPFYKKPVKISAKTPADFQEFLETIF